MSSFTDFIAGGGKLRYQEFTAFLPTTQVVVPDLFTISTVMPAVGDAGKVSVNDAVRT